MQNPPQGWPPPTLQKTKKNETQTVHDYHLFHARGRHGSNLPNGPGGSTGRNAPIPKKRLANPTLSW